MDKPTTLYRMWGADELLYVGISNNAPRRFEEHAGDKSWWPQVLNVTVEHFPTRDEALAAEILAIHREFPVHNRAGVLDGFAIWQMLCTLEPELLVLQDECMNFPETADDCELEFWFRGPNPMKARVAKVVGAYRAKDPEGEVERDPLFSPRGWDIAYRSLLAVTGTCGTQPCPICDPEMYREEQTWL